MKFHVLFERLDTGKRFWEKRETDSPEHFEAEMQKVAMNLEYKLLKIQTIPEQRASPSWKRMKCRCGKYMAYAWFGYRCNTCRSIFILNDKEIIKALDKNTKLLIEKQED